MKALSIRQPWAWAIVCAGKDIENRSWQTSYRGPVLIHASGSMTREEYEDFRHFYGTGLPGAYRSRKDLAVPGIPTRTELQFGGIIGRAEIVDCVRAHPSPWFMGEYGFVLANAEALPFLPYRGQLGLFEVEMEVAP